MRLRDDYTKPVETYDTPTAQAGSTDTDSSFDEFLSTLAAVKSVLDPKYGPFDVELANGKVKFSFYLDKPLSRRYVAIAHQIKAEYGINVFDLKQSSNTPESIEAMTYANLALLYDIKVTVENKTSKIKAFNSLEEIRKFVDVIGLSAALDLSGKIADFLGQMFEKQADFFGGLTRPSSG